MKIIHAVVYEIKILYINSHDNIGCY